MPARGAALRQSRARRNAAATTGARTATRRASVQGRAGSDLGDVGSAARPTLGCVALLLHPIENTGGRKAAPPPRRRLGTSRGFLGKPLWALAVARRGRRGGGALARCQRRRPERKGRGNIQNGLSH